MSFSPLPAPFLEFLGQCDFCGALALDLGCGPDVAWSSSAPAALRIVNLDRRGPDQGTAATLVGDATQPPLLAERFDLVVASNLYRHIVGTGPGVDPLPCWQGLVRPGGCLFVFEDEPGSELAAESNYADLQRMLARLMPESRGELLPLERFAGRPGGGWSAERLRNAERPDTEAVCAWLAAGNPEPGHEVGRLIERIGRDGLSYGRYWWARWQRPAG